MISRWAIIYIIPMQIGTQSDSSLGEMAELVESLEARYVRFDHETNRLRE